MENHQSINHSMYFRLDVAIRQGQILQQAGYELACIQQSIVDYR